MKATPENTPVPGGGSWHWDYKLGIWVANTEAPESAPAPAADAPIIESYLE
ncbi:MAG: hypothetical protein LAD29_00160 [Rhodoferax sp.]|nr:hypothetical protein [Rhodoferax sp.]